MSLKSDVKDGLYDVLENVKIHRARQAEIAKFKDPKRKSILSDVELSSEQMRAIDKFYVENYGRKSLTHGIGIILRYLASSMLGFFQNSCLSLSLNDI